MLNELERRILRYMVAQNSDGCISIHFPDVELQYQIDAVKSLAQKGYVKSAVTLLSASAILTAKGKYAIKEESDMLYGAYADKIMQLERYIDEGEHIRQLKDNEKAISFINIVLDAYSNHIDTSISQGIRLRLGILVNAQASGFYCEDELLQVMAMLKSILGETKIEATKQNAVSIQNNFSPVINQTTTVDVNINNVVDVVSKSGLSAEDQIVLMNLLKDIDANKHNKHKLWDKIKNALKYVIDKGIEVAAIVLPFVAPYIK